MSGMFGGKSTTSYADRLSTLQVQSSSQGVAIPMVWGRRRVAPNLLWFGDFVAIEHRETQGGKGGGGATQVNYTYQASAVLGLCAGQLNALPRRVWRDKDVLVGGSKVYPPQQLSLTATIDVTRKVTVPEPSRWLSDAGVRDAATGEANVTDYTVAAGIYTFGIDLVGVAVTIYYLKSGTTETFNALQAAGFSTHAAGYQGQAPWGYLTTAHPGQALGYSGLAYVGGTGLDLSGSAGLKQYSFEVDARQQVSGEIPDVNPADVCTDLLTDPLYGAVPGATWLGNLSQFRAWCSAMGIYLSPLYTERKSVMEYVKQIAEICFARPLWRVDGFTLVPLATEAIGGFTPLPEHSGPVYLITDDDINEPIDEQRAAPADRYNRVSVQYVNRAGNYAEAVESAEDKAAIDAFGLIPEPDVFQASEIAETAIAAIVAQLRLRQILSVQGTYKFNLPVNFDLLEPVDIIAIADARIDLGTRAVRIVEIAEIGDEGGLAITAEDVEITGAVTQASQASGGYGNSPAVIDPTTLRAVLMPTAATNNVQQVWVGATAGVNWGGATLWISDTGTDYRRLGTFNIRARMGTLTAALAAGVVDPDTSHTMRVAVSGKAVALATVAQSDVDAARSLMWVDGELLAYRDAELTGVQAFDLTYLRRGLYGSDNDPHGAGAAWMRLDEAVLHVDVPADLLGKTMYLKATGRNVLGTAEQGLDEVSPLLLDVVARQSRPTAPPALALTAPFVSTYFEANWGPSARAYGYEVEVRSAAGVAPLRSVSTSAQVFRYLNADAVDDGGPLREYLLRVRGVNEAGAGPWSDLVVTNPAPAAVEGIAASGTGLTRTLTWDAAPETDRAGYRVWISDVEDFDPQAGEGTQIYDGVALTAEAAGLVIDTSYYVRVAAYDVWSAITADLNLSDQFSFSTE